jgi:hypothetical protein
MKIRYLVVLFVLTLVSCQSDENVTSEKEIFTGELAVADIKESPSYTYHDTDDVIFSIQGSKYTLEHLTHNTNFCNSEGKAIGFGTNTLRLTPTFVTATGNCDSLKIPQGQFKSVFRGDSLFLGPDTQVFVTNKTDTMIYHFRLTK